MNLDIGIAGLREIEKWLPREEESMSRERLRQLATDRDNAWRAVGELQEQVNELEIERNGLLSLKDETENLRRTLEDLRQQMEDLRGKGLWPVSRLLEEHKQATASNPGLSPDRGANYHSLWAKTTRKVLTQNPIYRVECSCGWESQWTTDPMKSLHGHIYRAQQK